MYEVNEKYREGKSLIVRVGEETVDLLASKDVTIEKAGRKGRPPFSYVVKAAKQRHLKSIFALDGQDLVYKKITKRKTNNTDLFENG
jgi:hypothetical protein